MVEHVRNEVSMPSVTVNQVILVNDVKPVGLSLWSHMIGRNECVPLEYFRCQGNGRFADVPHCKQGRYFECVYFGQCQCQLALSLPCSHLSLFSWFRRFESSQWHSLHSYVSDWSLVQRIERSMWLSKCRPMLTSPLLHANETSPLLFLLFWLATCVQLRCLLLFVSVPFPLLGALFFFFVYLSYLPVDDLL